MSLGDSRVEGNSGVTNGSGEALDPAAFAAASGGSAGNPDDGFVYGADGQPLYNKDGSRKRKRGRRAGAGAGAGAAGKTASAADLKASVDVLSGTLQLLHFTAANALGIPELVLQPSEGDSLAKATVNVMEQFDLKPDPKTQALVGLVCVAGTIYGPRIYNYKARKDDEAKAAATGEAVVTTASGEAAGTTPYKAN